MPYALMIGVPYDLFWHLNPRKLKAFAMAYARRRQEQLDGMWYMGQLVAAAMDATVCNMMPFVKRPQKGKYPEKPIRILPETEAERKAAEERELQKFIGFAGALENKVKSKTTKGE